MGGGVVWVDEVLQATINRDKTSGDKSFRGSIARIVWRGRRAWSNWTGVQKRGSFDCPMAQRRWGHQQAGDRVLEVLEL